jgi:hypothetical protein
METKIAPPSIPEIVPTDVHMWPQTVGQEVIAAAEEAARPQSTEFLLVPDAPKRRLTARIDDTREWMEDRKPSGQWASIVDTYVHDLMGVIPDPEGIQGADEETLITFSRAHVAEITAQQTSPELAPVVEEEKRIFLEQQEGAIAEGWVNQYARTVAPRVANANVLVGDLWSTVTVGMDAFRSGNDLVIRQGYEGDANERVTQLVSHVREDIAHELEHLEFDSDVLRKYPTTAEAGFEHVRLSMRDGGWRTVSPIQRGKEDLPAGVYPADRELMATLLEDGANAVGAWRFTQAVTSGSTKSPAFRTFTRLLDRAWGTADMLKKVEGNIRHCEKQLRAGHPDLDETTIYEDARQMVYESLKEEGAKLRARRQTHQDLGRITTNAV